MPTPPPGYGYYVRYYRPNGGSHTAACGWSFRNIPNSTAAAARAAISAIAMTTTRAFEQVYLKPSWAWVGDYCLVNLVGTLYSDSSSGSAVGTGVGDPVPPQVSGVVSKKTALAGRQYRGRFAYPAGFIDEASVDDAGNIVSPAFGQIDLRVNNLYNDLVAANYQPYLVHGPDQLGVTPPPTAITEFELQPLTGSQRKRVR